MTLFTRHTGPTISRRQGRFARRSSALVALVALAVILPLLPARPAAAAPSVPVTLTITRYIELVNEDPNDDQHCGDYYAAVTIDGQDEVQSKVIDGNTETCDNRPAGTLYTIDFTDPSFTFTQNVDPAKGSATVTIEMLDEDNIFNADDRMDINPLVGPGDPETMLNLTVNLTTGNWTDDVGNVNQQFSTGAFDPDDPDNGIGTVFFTISTSSSADSDGDFLLDDWEINGLKSADGTINLDLPGMGANPQRRDLFLEIDCLVAATHSHCPLQGAIQAVVQSFADAPVNNVDGTTGIQLHIDIGNLYGHPALPAAGFATKVLRTGASAGGLFGNFGNFGGGGSQIAEAGNLIVDWDGATGRAATNFFSLKTNNFNSQRDSVFRYAIFVHQTNARAASNDCTSGWAKGVFTVNFLVSLGGTKGTTGNPCWTTDTGGNSIGSQSEQAGTLMHEFGHALGLDHGGGDPINNKPNYLSVMNYAISTGPAAVTGSVQFCGVPAVGGLPGGCDYSRFSLANLNEVKTPGLNDGLDECAGIGLGLGGFDWDGSGGLTGATCAPSSTNVSANINGDFNDINNDGTQDPGEANILGPLNGFDDWKRLRYDFRTIANFQSAGVPVEDEADPDTIAQARASLSQVVHPVLDVDNSGPADAVPGDTLSYSIKVKNSGRGPALNTALTDSRPDSTQAAFDLGTLVLGAERTRNVSFSVPCSAADGTLLTNLATAAAVDLLGNPVSGSDSVNTTVHAPSLTLSKTATASANAGEAIVYTITYKNAGSAAAAGVVISDILPADVYYSKALDLGAGPRPDVVTLNADGTRTLTWNVGAVPASSGPQTLVFTARPTLLALQGTTYTNQVSLNFQNANGCVYNAANASASTNITVVPPTRDPEGLGFWRNHSQLWLGEILARIQATDQRYDTNGDGTLSVAETMAMLAPGGNQPKVLQMQLLASYFNLATRRINAGTSISSKTTHTLGLTSVRDAAIFANDTLLLPVVAANRPRYDHATDVLDEINNNKSEVY